MLSQMRGDGKRKVDGVRKPVPKLGPVAAALLAKCAKEDSHLPGIATILIDSGRRKRTTVYSY